MYKYNFETLKNGLKLIRVPNKETNLILFQILMKLGNDLETKSILECGHFIEHLFSMFTSPKYPDGKKNREDMALKNIDLEAEIQNKSIKFVLEFEKKHIDYVIDLVTNALLDFIVDKTMFKQEQNAVIEELNEIIKDADYAFETKINKLLFKDHQRSYSEKMRLTNTKRLTSSNIESYYNKYFTSKNYVIGIFGDIDVKYYNILKTNMNKLKNKHSYKYNDYSLTIREPIIFYNNKEKVSNLKLIFNINSLLFEKEYYIIRGLIDILTGDLNSLLLKVLRNEQGLVYHCDGDYDIDVYNKGMSLVTITTLCNTKNLLKVIEYIIEVLNYIKNEYIHDKYINAYKSLIKIQKQKDIFSKNPNDVLTNYCTNLLWNKPIISFNSEYVNLGNINKELIKKQANRIFNQSNLVVCYDGNKYMNKQILDIVSRL
jgi:predicted Zn-dependent peptidase